MSVFSECWPETFARVLVSMHILFIGRERPRKMVSSISRAIN
jgi:hypothetical protein